jgi:Na+/proline symporter
MISLNARRISQICGKSSFEGGIKKLTLTDLMKMLQDFAIFIVIILMAYVVYKVGILIEVISKKIKAERD